MADTIFDIDALMVEMPEDEQPDLFKPASRRAPNFAAYQMKLNLAQIGTRFTLDFAKNLAHADAAEAVKTIRYNLNEAAKERVIWKPTELTEDEAAQAAADKKIGKFEREDGTVITRFKGEWKREVKEPVVLRFKLDTRDEEQPDPANPTGTKTVKIPTRMYVLPIATEPVVHRAPRGSSDAAREAFKAAMATRLDGESEADQVTRATAAAKAADAPSANGAAPEGAPALAGAAA